MDQPDKDPRTGRDEHVEGLLGRKNEHAIKEATALQHLQQEAAAALSLLQNALSHSAGSGNKWRADAASVKLPEPPNIDWLLSVDITDTRNLIAGTDVQTSLKRLEELAQKTKDKLAVVVVAQTAAEEPDDKKRRP